MADFGGFFSGIGGGISDFLNAGGLKGDAASLDKAGDMEAVNARIAAAGMDIQHAAAQRDIYKVSGGQKADIGAAGFTQGGTAGDLIRDTARQGSITQSLIQAQGEIDIQGHEIASANLHAQAASARSAAKASEFSGFLSIATGIFSLFSDKRLKTNIVRIGTGKNGLPTYSYTYRDDPLQTPYVGYMAQEVEKVDPSAIIDLGLKMVDSEYAPQKVA